MEYLLPILKDAVSLVADSKAILSGVGGVGTLLSVSGAIPRVGILRAFTFGLSSCFNNTHPLSIRKSEIKALNDSVKSIGKGSYITVIGGKGNGKSCLIDTTLNRQYGVIKISVSLSFCSPYSNN